MLQGNAQAVGDRGCADQHGSDLESNPDAGPPHAPPERCLVLSHAFTDIVTPEELGRRRTQKDDPNKEPEVQLEVGRRKPTLEFDGECSMENSRLMWRHVESRHVATSAKIWACREC